MQQHPSARAVFFATRSGSVTLDRDEAGGNPFASALIELANDPKLWVRDLASRLQELTILKSLGCQTPDYVSLTDLPEWSFHQELIPRNETRTALVLVVSDYSTSNQVSSLLGAAWDERRISAVLAQNGFSITQGIAPQRHAIVQALVSFKRRSTRSDVAIIYSTGHGIELDGKVFLIPGDYPVKKGYGSAQLKKFAIEINQIAGSAAGTKLNLVFFAGCRKIPKVGSRRYSEATA